ncbi:hypothetical protein ACIBG7_04990 [Nonomuraea sp. NPDC050328]|uniref:hypothetical protein n=1 Tax=Nonomuraea sp. NPDC050328 TaxID=3364361 RepID=UPI0037BC4FB6
MRLALAASAVGLSAATALVATTASSAQSAEVGIVARYLCTGGVAGSIGVPVEALVTPKVLAGSPGPRLAVEYKLTYDAVRRFGSPGYFAAGSILSLEAAVNISGAWNGRLYPKGGVPQPQLEPGNYLETPSGLSDAGSVERDGTIRIKLDGLKVKFTPAEGEVVVNNHRPDITYTGGWVREHTEEEFGDHLNDLHTTSTKDAISKFTFVGTQVAYVGRRERDLGDVRVLLDGQPVTDSLVKPGRDRNGIEMTGTKSKEVLWESPVLAYGQHTVEVINTEDKKAYVDAFRVRTGKMLNPPEYNQATCTLQSGPDEMEVTITKPSPSPTTTTTPPPTSTTTPPPTETDDPPTNPGNPDDDDHDHHQNPYPIIQLPERAVGQRQGTTTTTTPTPTPTPTKTTYVKAQVLKTPKGGVASGEAPDPGSEPYYLLLGGSVLLVGSTAGGLMMRRRRVALPKGIQA